MNPGLRGHVWNVGLGSAASTFHTWSADSPTDGTVLAGELPSGKTRLVQAWIEIHRHELLSDWQLAVNGEEVFKIEPLK